MAEREDDERPLAGYRIGVTAARKADEQAALLERRGASVVLAPALTAAYGVDDAALREVTEALIVAPPDLLVVTTGIGMRTWLAAADRWDLLDPLRTALASAEIVARGPKGVGALRRHGLDARWAAPSEAMAEVVDHLLARDLTGVRLALQEYGVPSAPDVARLAAAGAVVTTVPVYRVDPVADAGHLDALEALAGDIADGGVQAVTFTSAMAVTAFWDALAERLPQTRRAEVLTALRERVVVACVGAVTAAAFAEWGVPTIHPDRSRLLAMVRQLEVELPARVARPVDDPRAAS